MNAEEAEQVLGGVYSQLSTNMHIPLAYLLIHEINSDFLAALDADGFNVAIMTGLQALSRTSQNQALLIAANQINAVVGVLGQVSKRFNVDLICDQILLSNGIDPDTITYSQEELQRQQQQLAEQQAQQQQQAMMGQQQAMQSDTQLQATQAVEAAY